MEFFEAAKIWLSSNSLWLSPLAIVLVWVTEYFLKPLRSLGKFLFRRSNNQAAPTTNIENNPNNTVSVAPNITVSPVITVQGNSSDTAVLAENLMRVVAENANLKRDKEGLNQEKDALEKSIEDLQGRSGQEAAEALEHLKMGDTEQAKTLYRNIGEAKATEGASANKEASEAYCNLGAIAFLNNTDEALAAYAKATELDPNNANAWNPLGHLQDRKGNLDAAIRSYEHVLQLGKQNQDKTLEAIALGNLGLIAQTRGDLDEAEDYQKRSLALNEELGNKQGIAATLGNLGLIAQTRGDLDGAEDYQKRSLALMEKLGNREGIAASLGNLGLIAETRGELDAARRLWGQARDLFAEIGMPHMVEKHQGWIDDLDKDSD